MREILFRGKSQYTGEWVMGLLTQLGGLGSCFDIWGIRSINGCYRVDDKTIGQYTGLMDKNGVKIFEGDIVKDIDWGNGRKSGIAVVKYGYHDVQSDDPFCYGLAYGVYFDGDTLLETPAQYFGYDKYQKDERYQFEVIGNIHDNPELLEEENNR